MKISVNWLQDFVKISPPFENTADHLTMAGLEVKKFEPLKDVKDFVFEIEITTNRPDWLSHLGVAREIAAIENLSLHLPETDKTAGRPQPTGWKINLREMEGCPYYSGVLIEGINPQETPDFIKERLYACGLRSIDLIVDITNYVLLETGQPLHAFDADLLQGKEIQIRKARPEEKMIMIDGKELALSVEDLVIADNQNAIALAGVMGGKGTEVNTKTRNIFLESAFFHPRWIRQSAKRHSLSSDSSYRFERRVDPEGVDLGRSRALWLIQKYAKPRFVSAVIKAGNTPVTSRSTIPLSEAFVTKVLGTTIKASEISSILTRLGLTITGASDKAWNVKPPSFRLDLTRPIDLVEEIARIHGYDNIPETLPERPPILIQHNPLLKLQDQTRRFFSGIGLHETVTFSLINQKGLEQTKELKEAVTLINPQNKELSWMRPLLLTSLLEVIKRNSHLGAQNIPLFEIANCYQVSSSGKHSAEERMLGIALFGRWKSKTWLDAERNVTFYDLKGMIEAFLEKIGIQEFHFKSCRKSFLNEAPAENLMIGAKEIGFLGETHPHLLNLWDLESSVYFAQLSLEKIRSHIVPIKPLHELPRFPSIERDIALVVSESVKAGEIQEEIRKMEKKLIAQVQVFDLFRGGRIPKGCKNLGFRVIYQSCERTLISEEIQSLHSGIADKIAKKFNASFQ